MIDLVIAQIAVIALLMATQKGTRSKTTCLLYGVPGSVRALINIIEIVLIFKQCTPTVKLWDYELPGQCDMMEICLKFGSI